MENESELARYTVVIALSYIVGSVPWGYMLLQWRRGVDVRDYGSGRTGMTNVLRTGGGKFAAAVLLLDFGKGVLAVLLARQIIDATAGEAAAGLAVLAGHNWPVFLGFRGGRGIAPGFGGLMMMAPIAAGIGFSSFIPIILISRYLSLGSVLGLVVTCLATLGLVLAGVYSSGYIVYAFVGSAVIIWQHRDNIQRIRNGTERRLGQPAK
ncbi:MAG: acyl-phosphate glycerol 3-phosphate acyltransferase [SAR202 cluster bacterium Io17-Chloro-G7]|nr:MAG: acyl-phosphate glycerol 3-phosphate acyltransferase [SAR202 cluster bacterium Io17-Chloro-G7]